MKEKVIICPQCNGTNDVSDLGASWAYEPGPCPLCDGKEVVRCNKCGEAHRKGKKCFCKVK